MIFYEGQLSRSHLELSFAKITVLPDGTNERTDIGSAKLADVIGASRNNILDYTRGARVAPKSELA